jgi:hypothetical protein
VDFIFEYEIFFLFLRYLFSRASKYFSSLNIIQNLYFVFSYWMEFMFQIHKNNYYIYIYIQVNPYSFSKATRFVSFLISSRIFRT